MLHPEKIHDTHELCIVHKEELLEKTRRLREELRSILDINRRLFAKDPSVDWETLVSHVKGIHHRHGVVLRLTLSEDRINGAENSLLYLEQSIEGWKINPIHQFSEDKIEQPITFYGVFINMIKLLLHSLEVLDKEIQAGWIEDSLVSLCLGLSTVKYQAKSTGILATDVTSVVSDVNRIIQSNNK